MSDIYYIDGEFVKDSEAVISVNDMAILRGFGVFDFLRTYGGKPFFLEDHIKRLENSGKLIGVHLPKTNKVMKIPPSIAQSPHAMTSLGSGIARYVFSSASSIWRDTGPVTSNTSACLGEATKSMPKLNYTITPRTG